MLYMNYEGNKVVHLHNKNNSMKNIYLGEFLERPHAETERLLAVPGRSAHCSDNHDEILN